MDVNDRPCLRPGLGLSGAGRNPQAVSLWDRFRLTDHEVTVSLVEFACVRLFDGTLTLAEVQTTARRLTGGYSPPIEHLSALADRLDRAYFLTGPRFDALAARPIREPSCIGCYDGTPARLRRQLATQFTLPGGPGTPGDPRPVPGERLCAALLPHIDYGRAKTSYAWGFKEVVERSDASLFVVIGTSHYSGHRFTLTRKHFRTPLGVAETDQRFIDRLVAHYGDGLFADELQAHLPEHSIELEVVFLQYLYEGKRPIRIVPLVVGSFHDCVANRRPPSEADDVGRMIRALRAAEAETADPVCYIISGDLAHIGPKFEDPDPVAEPLLGHSRGQDQVLLKRAEAVDPDGYFAVIAEEDDARRICGLPPTYVTLAAARPSSGRLLNYEQHVAADGSESVSFASMAFYRSGP